MFFIFTGQQDKIKIMDKPIDFGEKRIQLTLNYIHDHYGLDPKNIGISPRIIVLHWIESNDFNTSFQILKPETIQYGGIVARAGNLNVSAHFLVDRDGTIYRLMPENWPSDWFLGTVEC